MRNPNQIKQKLGGALDPSILQQFGGIENMMGMMKQIGQLEKSGGLGDIGKMLSGMGGLGGLGGGGKKRRR